MLPDAELRLPVPDDVDVRRTVLALRNGPLDPTWLDAPGEVVHAFATPDGPGTIALLPRPGDVLVRAWGPGTAFLLPRLGDLLGGRDDADGFRPRHPWLADLARRSAGLRLALHPTPVETLVAVILQQRVAWKDAVRSWRLLCAAYGDPAPGPYALLTAPEPRRVAELGYAAFHPHGVEHRRAVTVREACRRRGAIDRLRGLPAGEAYAKLQVLPGVGPWTAGMTAGHAFVDADAVPLGDLNLPSTVAHVLAGEERADDARMLELLEPFRPHRWRVLQLLLASGRTAPRHGPRISGRWAPGA
jgi:3-methyladenine DNA glycosylase/8-oxoguanine DNA glycosylase